MLHTRYVPCEFSRGEEKAKKEEESVREREREREQEDSVQATKSCAHIDGFPDGFSEGSTPYILPRAPRSSPAPSDSRTCDSRG